MSGMTILQRTLVLSTSLVALVVPGYGVTGMAIGQPDAGDPSLAQSIPMEQGTAAGRAVVSDGHIDLGPVLRGHRWALMLHDDSAGPHAGVWRHLDRTVLHLTDAARQTMPDGPAYAFVGAPPGSPVFVAPQTQNPEVVWIGWNTQDPEVMRRIDRGVTLTLSGIQGPGEVSVYLQSGAFGEPQELWSSRSPGRSTWVEANTHAHANWVFTRPGVYLVRLTVAATLRDGRQVTDERIARFAVGSATDPQKAMTAAWVADTESATGDTSPDADREGSPIAPVPAVTIILVAAAVVLTVMRLRSARAKRRARTDRGVES